MRRDRYIGRVGASTWLPYLGRGALMGRGSHAYLIFALTGSDPVTVIVGTKEL